MLYHQQHLIFCVKWNFIFTQKTVIMDFSGFHVAKSCVSPLDWKPVSKQTWKAVWKGQRARSGHVVCMNAVTVVLSFTVQTPCTLIRGCDSLLIWCLQTPYELFSLSHIGVSTEQNYWTQMAYLQVYLSLKELLRLLKGSYTHSAWHARLGWGDRNSNRRKVCRIHR